MIKSKAMGFRFNDSDLSDVPSRQPSRKKTMHMSADLRDAIRAKAMAMAQKDDVGYAVRLAWRDDRWVTLTGFSGPWRQRRIFDTEDEALRATYMWGQHFKPTVVPIRRIIKKAVR